MKKIRMLSGLAALGVFLSISLTISAWASDCDILLDDFSNVLGFATTYQTKNGDWNSQGGTLNISNVTSGKSALAIRSFAPSGPFSMDIDVDVKTNGESNYVGLYVYTDGDVLFGVSDITTDGVEVLVYPNSGHVYFYFWNPIDQQWYNNGPYSFSGTLHSFGLTLTEEKVIFRLNGADTNLDLPVSFENFDLVMDKMWIEAGGDDISASFDNLCVKTYDPQAQGTTSSQESNGFSLPDQENVYIISPATTPTTAGAKDQIIPIGLGSAASGGSTLDLHVALPEYKAPVDIYLALTTSLAPDEIFLFDDSNQIVSLSQGLAIWKSDVSEAIDEIVLSGLPVSLFPNADFTFFLLVTPTGGALDVYDLWVSYLKLGSSQGSDIGQSNSSNNTGNTSGSAGDLQAEITPIVEQALGLAPSLKALSTQFSDILSGDSSSDIITISPSDINIFDLPSSITVDINFGSGYTLEDGSVVSGSARLVLSNVEFNQSGLGADFVLTADSLSRDGQELLDGTCTGSLKMTTNSSGNGDLTGNISLTGLKVNGESVSGNILISGKNIDISEETFDEIVVTPQNLTYGDFSISSGTITLKQTTASRLEVNSDLQTSMGPIALQVVVTPYGSNGYEVNTTSQGNIMGYGIQVNGLIYDSDVCENYPIGGSILITKDSQSGRVSFTDACDGSYNYSE